MDLREGPPAEPPVLLDHGVALSDGGLLLRPLTENDWNLLLRWNNDAEVLYFTEGDDVVERSVEEVQAIWRAVALSAYCFVVELDGEPIGECWLQRMNLDEVLRRFEGRDCRRIDLCIGEKGYWDRGIGTRVIRLLTRFALERENADAVFGIIGGHNPRSKRAFEKAGYRLFEEVPEIGPKSTFCWHMVAFRDADSLAPKPPL